MQCTRIAPAARIAGVLIALGLLLVPATDATADDRTASASERLLIPSAGWQGRSILDPHRHRNVPTSSADRPPRGWSAGPVSMGTGTHRPSGSQRVREVQRRLRALGYRPGPIDGIFGRRTRAAVGWFQYKHGFHVDGRATLAVVRHLRARTGAAGGEAGGQDPAGKPPGVNDAVDASTPGAGVQARDGTASWMLPAALALLAFAIGFAAVALLMRRGSDPERPSVLPVTGGPQVRALAYVRVEAPRTRLDAHAAAIETRCAEQGMALTALASDDGADERAGRQRPGLAFALEQLETGEADCLVVGRLGHLARSPAELTELLDSMSERETPLVVLNADPETKRTRRWSGGRRHVPDVARARGRRRPDG